MKCIQKGKTIKRVKDELAAQRVQDGWKYISKEVWKEKRRGPVDSDKCQGLTINMIKEGEEQKVSPRIAKILETKGWIYA
jgi:hypothetical protein